MSVADPSAWAVGYPGFVAATDRRRGERGNHSPKKQAPKESLEACEELGYGRPSYFSSSIRFVSAN